MIGIEILSIWSVAYTYKLTLKRPGHRVSTAYQFDLHLQRIGLAMYAWAERRNPSLQIGKRTGPLLPKPQPQRENIEDL